MAKGKKQRVIKQLRHAHQGLVAAKRSAIEQGMEPRDAEYEELVVIAKGVYFEAHCACMDAGVDPIPICLNLNKLPPKRKR